MKIIKALHPSLLHKTYQFKEKSYFSVSLLWGFELTSGEPILEQALWKNTTKLFEAGELFDTGMPKPQGEALMFGRFIANKPVTAGRASFKLGTIHKEVAVFGDRHWKKALGVSVGVSSPEPFTEMLICSKNAFGGKEHSFNTEGKGIDSITTETGDIVPLPNVEDPSRLIGSPSDKPKPALFTRVDVTWEPRLAFAGTYDDKYIQEQMPGLPNDIDWRMFNDAQNDQWIDDYFAGNESYEIRNMNAEHPLIRGKLPEIKGRCFVRQTKENESIFREIETRLDTVWLFPNDNMGVLIHRGVIEVDDNDARDITQILIAHEGMNDKPRSTDYYQQELLIRTDSEKGALQMLNTAPMLPEGTKCGLQQMIDDNPTGHESSAQANIKKFTDNKTSEINDQLIIEQQKALAQLEQAGIEAPQELLNFDMNTANQTPEKIEIERLMEEALPGSIDKKKEIDFTKIDFDKFSKVQDYVMSLSDDALAKTKERISEEIVKLEAIATEHPKMESELRTHIKSLQDMLNGETKPVPLPRIDIEPILKEIEEKLTAADTQLAALMSMGIQPDSTPSALNFDVEEQKLALSKAVVQAMEGYKQGAHMIDNAESPHAGQEEVIRDKLLNDYENGNKTSNTDYAFLDLSGCNLAGIDLSNCYLEHVNFEGASLAGANFDGAIIAYSNFNRSNLTGASLKNVNLGSCIIESSDFSDTDLTDSILSKSKITNSNFKNTRIDGRMDTFLEISLNKVDFSHAYLHKSTWLDVTVSQCIFSNCDLSESNIVNVNFSECTFTSTNLSKANMVNIQADNSDFSYSRLVNTRFVNECSLHKCNFQFSEMGMTNFMGANLTQCDFSKATLSESNFGDADLTGSLLMGVTSHKTLFNNAKLSNTTFHRADLMEASLYNADIRGAKFIEANMYAVNFHGCTVGSTDFTGANLEKTILKDWRP